MNPIQQQLLEQTRRQFLGTSARIGVGAAALASLLSRNANADKSPGGQPRSLAVGNGPGYGPGNPGPVHFPPTAKRVIYLCQAGAPSQIDTFDYKPAAEIL